MEYLLIKVIHILSSTLLFGTGLGSAFYKWMADRGGDLHAMAKTNRTVVIADWLFTTPTVIIQPITGFWLVHILGFPLDQPWVVITVILYLIAGGCWLPVVWLQMQMARMAEEAVAAGSDLPPRFWRYHRIWTALGVPAFAGFVLIFYFMVVKPA